MYQLYMHITPNNKKYIGITKLKLNARWKNGEGYKSNVLFYRAINKYGWNNIKHIVLLSNLTKEEAETKEIEYIAKYKSNNNKYGYNIENGGKTIGTISEITKEKLRKAHLNKKQSNETKEKHRQAALKLWQDNSFREKIKESYYKKQKKKRKYKCRYKPGKMVICIETKKVFNRIKDASEYYDICDESIRKCCHKKRNIAGGYHWTFYEEGLQC